MGRFRKLVAIEPIRFDDEARRRLHDYAEEVILYDDIPSGNAEIIRRIGNAEAVLVFYTSRIDKEVIEACPSIRYIGMCCSLYTPESANVDIRTAEKLGIKVTGIRRYGDRGVPEFIISEIIRLFHGFGGIRFREEAIELADMRIGIIGMGDVGKFVAEKTQAMDMDVYYFSCTRKPEAEARGIKYLPLDELLATVDVISTHLHKNTAVMDERHFELFGDGKLIVNTTFTPPYPLSALKEWLMHPGNYFISDNAACIGGRDGEIFQLHNVICPDMIAGQSVQSGQLLRVKVLENIADFLHKK